MRHAAAVVLLLGLASCGSPGTAEDFHWTVECPKRVGRGAEFAFTVRAVAAGGGEVPGLGYRYRILWTPGSGSALRHHGSTGSMERAHARVLAGPATLEVLSDDREGRPVKVAEAGFEVN